MAVGDFLVRINSSETTVLPNTGSTLTSTWDSTDKQEGSGITYSAGTFTLPVGMYLIMYSETFDTADTTNNERITASGEIFVNGIATGGYSGDYIRKASGQQEMSLTGSMFHEVTSGTDDISIRFHRTDNSTSGTVNRVPNMGGVQIIQLDSNAGYGFYETTSNESTSGATVRTLNISSNVRQDTGFSRSGSAVTLSSAGRYVVTYSMDISTTGTGREDVVGYLRKNGTTEITGTSSYLYLRGADASQAGGLTWMGLIDVAANDSIDVQWSAPQSATMTASSGASLQFWKLPSTSKEILVEATNGPYNNNLVFPWDTIAHIDIDQYTHTAGNSNIVLDSNDYSLCFATLHQNAADTTQRAYPVGQFVVDGNVDTTAVSGAYHRNSGGSGIIAITTSSLLSTTVGANVEFQTTAYGAAGTLTNDSGQMGIVSLSKALGVSYVFPPTITVAPAQIDNGDANIVITGINFSATQGTGKLEISDNSTYGLGTIVTQSVFSWSDTSIQFDADLTGITDGNIYVYVTNDAGKVSSGKKSNTGVPAYIEVVKSLNPDIFHTLDNTYADESGVAAANSQTSLGTFGFNLRPLCRGATYSWAAANNSSRIEMNDTKYTNVTTTHTKRLIGGWIQAGKVYLVPSGFYEEGGGVNNLYMVIGFGNILLGNIADSSGSPVFKVQAYSDFKLTPGRPYHVMVKFIGGDRFTMFVDGVEVQKTDGNPITDTTMSTHSGDWSYGKPDSTLDTGGTDIQYPSGANIDINYFATWSGLSTTFPTDLEIRTELFEKGAIATDTISPDTEANMQIALDALTGINYVDKPLPLKISKIAGSLKLELNNITFDERCSIHVQYMGTAGQTLTLVNNGTSNCDLSMCSTPYGGTIVIENPATFTVNGIIAGSIVEIYDNEVVNLENHDTKLASTNNSGTSFQFSHSGINNDIIVKMFADGYKEVTIPFTLSSVDQTLTITPERELNA